MTPRANRPRLAGYLAVMGLACLGLTILLGAVGLITLIIESSESKQR